jgi:hypothetical protein
MAQVPRSRRATIPISVINQSTVLTDDQVSPSSGPCKSKLQMTSGLSGVLTPNYSLFRVEPNRRQVPGGCPFWTTLTRPTHSAITTSPPTGLPIGKVFAGTDLKIGASWSVTASHELLEMLADPNINLTVFVQNADTTGTLYAYEACDASEAETLGYQIDNILLSDFVFPSWFESFRAQNSTQFDQTGHIQGPLQLLPGGYIGVFDVSAGTGWHQMTAEKCPVSMAQRGKVGSRRERRRIPRELWLVSVRIGKSRAEPRTTVGDWCPADSSCLSPHRSSSPTTPRENAGFFLGSTNRLAEFESAGRNIKGSCRLSGW